MNRYSFYPALTGSKTQLQGFRKFEEAAVELTARKRPIGSTNNQWGPLIEVSLYSYKGVKEYEFSIRGL